ncbi:secretin N-terminal domain-containing protein [Sulfurimonas sp.]|uniref:secretin N-terminal domain-containing protein n=1 Tax=Sulfurimonas sp. TaxID=2022749 RepID=UPI002B48F2CD|nr:secretin N-terminal domain-containing protein [Sulfurimonas sp.]
MFRYLFIILFLVFNLNARSLVNVNFSNLKINEFIKIVSKLVNKNILVTDIIEGQVNLVSNVSIYDDELISILSSVLKSKDYTLIKNGSIYEVIKISKAVKSEANYKGSLKNNSFIVSHLIQIKNNDVDIIASKLKSLTSIHSNLITIKSSNMILISDYPKNINVIKKIIKKIDIKLNNDVFMYEIKNVQAKALLTYLNESSKLLFNDSLKSDKVKILLHEDLNSIIVIGKKSNVLVIEKLIKKFDIESSNNQTLKIFNLKNAKADEVFKALNDIIKNQKFSDESLKPNVSKSDDINSIIVVGVPHIIKALEPLIKELDKEKYQVYVEARIIDINKKNSEDLGIKYNFDGARLLSSGGLLSFSSNFSGIAPIQGLIGKNLSSSLVGDGLALGASIDFLQTNGASKSISNPSILCVNNKESSIYVGKAISLQSGSVSASDSGVTNSYVRTDIGLTLKIIPRVSSSDKVTLEVSIILENIIDDGSNNETGQPVTSKQEINTQTILRHGENIIIGGLVKSYTLDSKSQIPLLGDIPFLGALFRSTSTTKEQDNLVVILTPYIIDNSEKLSQLQKDLGTLSKLQEKYNQEAFNNFEEEGLKDD